MGDQRADARIILKSIFTQKNEKVYTVFSGTELCPRASWCKHANIICGNKMSTRCNRGFYCTSYCLLNMFRASLCPSSGAQEYYTVVAACGISCCGFQLAGLVRS